MNEHLVFHRRRKLRHNLIALLFITVAVLMSLSPTVAKAAPPQVSTRFVPLSPRARVAAPVSGIWEIISSGSQLLEGELRLTIKGLNGEQVIVLTDVVITPGTTTRFRGMLPAIDVPYFGNRELVQVEMSVQFVASDGTEFLPEPAQLMFRNPSMQSFNICIADPHMAGGTAIERNLAKELAFERFNPNPVDNSLGTAPAHVAPRDLPNDPLSYCAFDMLLLADEGFMETDTAQRAAIAKWVAAGGSLCVVPRTSLDAPQLEFLNQLAKSADSEIIFVTDADGRLSASGAGGQAEFALLRVGLGRVAVGLLPDKSNRNPGSTQYRDMAAFLWKIKAEQLQSIRETGTFQKGKFPQIPNIPGQPRVYAEDFQQSLSLAESLATSRASDWSESLVGQLMPKTFRFVPLWLMCGLLFVFLLAIGPLDYFLLGAFKMRKMTWVLFPLTSFLFAYITVAAANAYMGVTNETHAYEILDIGDDSNVLRANRLELHYNGAAQHSETELTDALFTPLDTSATAFYQHQAMQEEELPMLIGRIPQQVMVVQEIPQWTPRLSRRFWIAPSEKVAPLPKFDFATVTVADLESPQSRAQLAVNLQATFGHQCSIFCLNGKRLHTLVSNSALFSNPLSGSMYADDSFPRNNYGRQNMQRMNVGRASGDEFIRLISAPLGISAFNYVSQVSPAGGWSFDDLAMLDINDPDEWLLIIAQPRGDDVVIYRKLYRRADASPKTPNRP
ncbi:hypothetical protein CA54_37190 [Symmachiella macrocystis]|uniref:Uncharacterized protein n=1 Tax=Symmachiella macrocystis TaxID=2527985 RepID=A0A5C6BW00_9PLAN|nr:hypothetical protein [Symmachiella macrocystis]TWU14849.1 hypothetical protein CA54_37190 [Symmachiella macrocystis]